MSTPDLGNGYLRLANELCQAFAKAKLTGREFRVVLAIMRMTYGYGKKEAIVSRTLLSEITGIHRRHVSDIIKSLIQKDIITVDRSSRTHRLGVNKHYDQWSIGTVDGADLHLDIGTVDGADLGVQDEKIGTVDGADLQDSEKKIGTIYGTTSAPSTVPTSAPSTVHIKEKRKYIKKGENLNSKKEHSEIQPPEENEEDENSISSIEDFINSVENRLGGLVEPGRAVRRKAETLLPICILAFERAYETTNKTELFDRNPFAAVMYEIERERNVR